MPWLSEATKDVTSCDKPCVGANTRMMRGFPNGATRRAQACHPPMAEANPGN